MTTSDFTTTISVEQTMEAAFQAITNPRGWWSAEIEGVTDLLNAVSLYRYKDMHFCKLQLIELIPGRKVVWLVLDNYFKFTNDKTEWKGTRLVFTLSRAGNKTEIRFTHEGLVPEYECYEVCEDAWTYYVNESLYGLITTGAGNPNAKEDNSPNAALVEKWKMELH